MKRICTVGLCLVAVFAISATTASAGKPMVTLRYAKSHEALKPGAPITGNSANLVYSSEAGNIECSENELTGTLLSNGATNITAEFTTGRFEGEEPGKLCKTTFLMGPAIVTAIGLPWTLEYKAMPLKAILKGTPALGLLAEFPGEPAVMCSFKGRNHGAKSVAVPPSPLFMLQKLPVLDPPASKQCPKNGTLSGAWEYTSEGEALELSV